ncbi:hypothetical protein B0I32_1822 [Nonomuraea fuscirosea]|uniref:Uncharacterized protein n=1 Tax=Nonomuraea fuscirosea TaxID=1291556 RepID=A0A2T0LFE8_9ACTN|nr:hypothetical protein B0I32_1822 [Nonomuraea fuscirosea]
METRVIVSLEVLLVLGLGLLALVPMARRIERPGPEG